MHRAEETLAWLRGIKVTLRDEAAAESLSPAAVRDYLRAAGWMQVGADDRPGVAEYWTSPGTDATVLLPLNKDFADFARRMLSVVNELAAQERRGVLGVLLDLRDAAGPGSE